MHLNPEMLLEIAKEYLRHCAADPEAADPASPGAAVLSKATKLLTLLVAQVRGGGGRRGKRARGRILDGDSGWQMMLVVCDGRWVVASGWEVAGRCLG